VPHATLGRLFVQIVSLIPRVYDLESGKDLEMFDVEEQGYMRFWHEMSQISGVDILAVLPCTTFEEQLYLISISPIALAAFLLVVGTMLQVVMMLHACGTKYMRGRHRHASPLTPASSVCRLEPARRAPRD
jgi:hypothetical protein